MRRRPDSRRATISARRPTRRAAALATAQVERADKLFADVAQRLELAMNNVQGTLGAPAREARAILSALKAAVQAIRDIRHDRGSRQRRSDDEDALFI